MNTQTILMALAITMIIVLIITTSISSRAANLSEVTTVSRARKWATASAVVSGLAIFLNIGALGAMYYGQQTE